PVRRDVPLKPRTTWRIGGPARWLITPVDGAEIAGLLAAWPENLPRVILGGGSNLLISDKGVHGAVMDLTQGMNRIYTITESLLADAECLVHADAGATTQALAHFARRLGLTGAEFLAGIPGSVGGALRMNAGAHGGAIRDLLVEADLIDPAGGIHRLPEAALGMGYRHCGIDPAWIFTGARFRFRPDDPARIRERMRAFNQRRRRSQPLAWPSAGSVFKNPPSGPLAWELLDRAGLRGMRIGDAQVSEMHCNFFINLGQATAREMRELIDRAQETVADHAGILLEPEIKFVGWE
ncbi:MAG: UDP-N-acetylmuramate dehydrogenase, partial [Magnetococcales bacterium]|nr:UDP-N-acetylmuramate dehydrogenase [Magnetococcales bacterium]